MRGQRIKDLTSETSNALHQTLVGIVDLIKTLLSQGHQYVLPGNISSDRTEGEFGIYRQSSGGNFLISAEQVFSGLQLQRIKLFSKLDIHVEGENIDSDCCKNELKDSEEDLNLVEQCFDAASNLNSTEKASLYYIIFVAMLHEKRVLFAMINHQNPFQNLNLQRNWHEEGYHFLQ